MGRIAVIVLKVIIGIALAGSVLVQVASVPLIWFGFPESTGESWAWLFGMLGAYVILGTLCLQVIGICIWRLLTRVRRGTVFSPASFREVHIVIAAIGAASILTVVLAVGFAIANRTTDGDVVAPGQVGLLLGLALVAAGVALVVYVMRMLLVQAIAMDTDARTLRAELDEVI